MILENLGKCIRGKLTPLVCVEYLGRPVTGDRLFKRLDTEGGIQSIGEPPGKNLTARPVHNGHKITESFRHGDVRYVRCPDRIAFCDRKSSQKIGVDRMAGMRFREAGVFIDRLYSHFSHEGANMASAYLVALVQEFIPDASAAEKRVLQMNLVDQTHEIPIFVAYRHRGVVDA